MASPEPRRPTTVKRQSQQPVQLGLQDFSTSSQRYRDSRQYIAQTMQPTGPPQARDSIMGSMADVPEPRSPPLASSPRASLVRSPNSPQLIAMPQQAGAGPRQSWSSADLYQSVPLNAGSSPSPRQRQHGSMSSSPGAEEAAPMLAGGHSIQQIAEQGQDYGPLSPPPRFSDGGRRLSRTSLAGSADDSDSDHPLRTSRNGSYDYPSYQGGGATPDLARTPPLFGQSTASLDAWDDSDSARGFAAGGGRPGRLSRGASSMLGGGLATYEEDKEMDPSLKSSGSGKNPALRQGGGSWWGRRSAAARRWIIILAVLLLIIIAVAVAIPVATSAKKANNAGVGKDAANEDSTSDSSSSGSRSATGTATSSGVAEPTVPTTGTDGSTVVFGDGRSFRYNNTFGGHWNSIPFDDSARAASDVPPLNERWDYNRDTIRGVNIGGWLMLEPFIAPAMFEPFYPASGRPTVVDEWTLSEALGTDLASTMEEHYRTFITEKDFAEIAAAGLSWIRLPIPYWIVETWEGEPFLANVGWSYFLNALTWARKYGLRVNLDLHAVPGSQNGYNHSSKLGSINFLSGVMGIANAQRTLNYIRTLTEFISQPQYSNLVPMFGILNEPYSETIGLDVLRSWYNEVYQMVRGIGGIGEGNGPIISFHDGFSAQGSSMAEGGWNGFLSGADRIAIDTHPYLCFSAPNNDPVSFQASKPCTYWAANFNSSTNGFGISMGGEWSLAINDCSTFLNAVGQGARYDGTYLTNGRPAYDAVGSCEQWLNWPAWSDDLKAGLRQVAQAHMDSVRHSFFWTWKTGISNTRRQISNPFWNYQLGLREGYMPNDGGRSSQGICYRLAAANGGNLAFRPATVAPSATGGPGAGQIASSQLARFAWPPASLGATPIRNLPTLTGTGAIITMAASTVTPAAGVPTGLDAGSGWANSADTAGWNTLVAGCSYPPAWSAVSIAVPSAPCGGSGGARRMHKRVAVPLAGPTPAPVARQ